MSGPAAARSPIFTAGLAGLVAGAVSMALGGHVSASSPRDSETAQLARQRRELPATSEQEVAEPIATYEAKGCRRATASKVAAELTAHLDSGLTRDADDLATSVRAGRERILAE